MNPVDFSIVYDEGDVAIIRNKSVSRRETNASEQRIRVQCFNSDQVERIFRYQEMQNIKNNPVKTHLINRLFGLH